MEKVISGETLDGVIDNHLTTIDELRKEREEQEREIKRLRKENIEAKRPKTGRLWVKVYKDTDMSFLSFRDRGILFSLCQLVDKNKGDYLIDRQTGGIIETWAQLGINIGIKDNAHTAEKCKKLIDKGILIVENLKDYGMIQDPKLYDYFMKLYNKNHAKGLHPDNFIKKRHFKLNKEIVSVGRDK